MPRRYGQVRGEASRRVARAWYATIGVGGLPELVAPEQAIPAEHPRPEGCAEILCGAPYGCQRRACRWKRQAAEGAPEPPPPPAEGAA